MINAICTTCRGHFLRKDDEHWKNLCLACFKQSKAKEWASASNSTNTSYKPTQVIEKEMLRRLIYLCHPDKHNSSEASLISTKWLLQLKDKNP
jgi:hypothetical protein